MTELDLAHNPPLMGCSHTANATTVRDGVTVPSCVSCTGIHPDADMVIPFPDLTGRIARCSCGRTAPSDPTQLFGLQLAVIRAKQTCAVCNYGPMAHDDETRVRKHLFTVMSDGHQFTPSEPREFDTYYCGCRGWD